MLFKVSTDKAFEGDASIYTFRSEALGQTWSTFGVFIPPNACVSKPVPVVWYFPGIMVSYQAGFIRGGLYEQAAKSGLGLIFPDSSPRGTGLAEEKVDYRLGPGAAYNADATAEPWCRYYKMFTHITEELPRELSEEGLPLDFTRQSCIGHSGGGHSAMQLHLLKPETYFSASGIAPFCDLMGSEIGAYVIPRMFKGGFDEFRPLNVPNLIKEVQGRKINILVTSGTNDVAAKPGGMMIDSLERAVAEAGIPSSDFVLEWHEGYTHSYHYNATIASRHLSFHADILKKLPQGKAIEAKRDSLGERPPWETRNIKKTVAPAKAGSEIAEWIDALNETHTILIFTHSGIESNEQKALCRQAEHYVATRPLPDDQILVIDVNGHPHQRQLEEYFAKTRGTRYWPACFTHHMYYGGINNLLYTTCGTDMRLGQPGV